MPSFNYKAKDRKGAVINGVLEAETRSAASLRLQSMGYFPIEVLGGKSDKKDALGGMLGSGPRVRIEDLSNFYRQMADLIGAGVPLVKALSIVKSQTENESLIRVLSQVNADVQGGETFAGALDKHPKVFSRLVVALVRAGETGGMLDQTLARVADFAESQDELRGKIKGALAYPVVMVVVGFAAVFALLTFVMPRILVIFTELNQALPAITQILINVSSFMAAYKLYILGAMVLGWVAFRKWKQTEKGAYAWHRLLISIPKVGDLIVKRELAYFTRTLGSLLRNGVPILSALTISSEVLTILPIVNDVKRIPESIKEGAGMAPTLRESPIFPPVVVNMVAIGEETGRLPEVLMRVAESYERQVERAVKTLTSFIEPMVILFLGIVVGFIVFATLLPIFSIDPTQGMG